MKLLTEIKIALHSPLTWDYRLLDEDGREWEYYCFDPDKADAITYCSDCGTEFEVDESVFIFKIAHPDDQTPLCSKCVRVVPLIEMRAAWTVLAALTELQARIARRLE